MYQLHQFSSSFNYQFLSAYLKNYLGDYLPYELVLLRVRDCLTYTNAQTRSQSQIYVHTTIHMQIDMHARICIQIYIVWIAIEWKRHIRQIAWMTIELVIFLYGSIIPYNTLKDIVLNRFHLSFRAFKICHEIHSPLCTRDLTNKSLSIFF